MKIELLTFQTTVRVTYDTASNGARKAAIRAARDLMNDLGQTVYTSDDNGGAISASPTRSVYRPKVPYLAPYSRMGGVDR